MEASVVVKFSWASQSRKPEAKFVKYAHNKAKETTGEAKVIESLAKHLTHRVLSKVALRFSEDKDLGELCDCPETLLSIKEVEDAVVFKRTMLEIIECEYLRRQRILSHISFSYITIGCMGLVESSTAISTGTT